MAIEESVRILLEACIALRAEIGRLPHYERESTAYRRFHALEEALQRSPELADDIRARLAERAREAEGAEFATWLTNAMGWFRGSKRTPPMSSKRTRKK
jgi:hypothetical protein